VANPRDTELREAWYEAKEMCRTFRRAGKMINGGEVRGWGGWEGWGCLWLGGVEGWYKAKEMCRTFRRAGKMLNGGEVRARYSGDYPMTPRFSALPFLLLNPTSRPPLIVRRWRASRRFAAREPAFKKQPPPFRFPPNAPPSSSPQHICWNPPLPPLHPVLSAGGPHPGV
jgi:hypothetical protein